jgi:hypothetical protein
VASFDPDSTKKKRDVTKDSDVDVFENWIQYSEFADLNQATCSKICNKFYNIFAANKSRF